MSKHTPGPWEWVDYYGAHWLKSGEEWVLAYAGCGSHDVDVSDPNARLIAAAPDLFEALLFAERRSRQPDESQLAWFERLADEFYHRHGYLAPGKDDPITATPDEERRAAWGAFLNEPTEARRAAIAKAKGEQQ